MARIRSIHPGLFTDEVFVSLSPAAQILWIGLWCEADDQGAFEWKPVTLKMRLLPASEDPIGPLLAELADAGCIRQYAVDGRQYGVIRNFARFQRPKAPKEVHPLPAPLRNYAGFTATGQRPSAGTGRKRAGTGSEDGHRSDPDDFETGLDFDADEVAVIQKEEEAECPVVPNEFRTASEAVPESERRGRREEEGWRNPSRADPIPDGAGGGTSHVYTPAHTREGAGLAGAAREGHAANRGSHPAAGIAADSRSRDAAAGGAR